MEHEEEKKRLQRIFLLNDDADGVEFEQFPA
jgi:hypothetical protein